MWFVFALGLGVLTTFFLLAWFLRSSLPKVNGELFVDGLIEPVRVDRDSFGVPHIQATSVRDAIFANGFVHAQDRLWQMELSRRLGAGRLAELLGEGALSADIFLRRLGLRKAAAADLDAMNDQDRDLLDAYCAGVNAGRASLGWRLPVEFHLLRLGFAPWTPMDSLTWIQVMSMDLCANWEQELLRGRILQKLGPQAAGLLHLFTSGGTLTVPPGERGGPALESLAKLYEEARSYLPNGGFPGASNAWVVGGGRSASGKPLLANDPHLVGRAPAIWYELHLEAPGLNVRGVGFAGLPLVVIGRNEKVAWGITNSFADTQDLYIEKFDPDRPRFYQTEEGWEEARVWEELISVKGSTERKEEVLVTRHGPVLAREGDTGLALRWINFEPAQPISTILDLNQAGSAEQFREALRHWQAPSSNFVFADVEGNFGYLMAGDVPVRARGTGLLPVPGWDGEHEWMDSIPFDELPQMFNPDCGYVVSANNPVVGPDFPHHITWDWMGASRAQRIEELLLSQEQHTVDSFLRTQLDQRCLLGPRFAAACQGLRPATQRQRQAWELLQTWDGSGDSESQAMCVYQVMVLSLTRSILEPLLGEALTAQFMGQSGNPVAVMAGHTGRYTTWLVQLLEEPSRFRELGHPQTLEALLAQALEEAVETLEKRMGAELVQWRWGKLHRLQFKHPLAINKLLGDFLDGPLVGVGGDTDTVFQTAIVPHEPYGAHAWCPSFRQVVDLANPAGAHSILPTGQSGHPMSPNYMDQFSRWLTGESRTPDDSPSASLQLRPRN